MRAMISEQTSFSTHGLNSSYYSKINLEIRETCADALLVVFQLELERPRLLSW